MTQQQFTKAVGNAKEINELLRRYGVKFGIYKNGVFNEQFFPFDPIPRVITHEDFQSIEKGLVQRVNALNEFLFDIYHDKKIVRDGIIPEDFIYISKGYLAECEGITPKNRVYSHISGIDLVQAKDGMWYILEDNLRIPSGASYPLIARELTRIAAPQRQCGYNQCARQRSGGRQGYLLLCAEDDKILSRRRTDTQKRADVSAVLR